MTCEKKQYIQIFKGDDTNWNNERFLNVTVTSELDLSEMTAKFILGSFTQTFPLTTLQFSVDLSHAVTGAFAYGPIDGVIQIIDSEKRIKTVTNTIPFYVTNKVIDEQDVDYQCNVSPNSPIEIVVSVGGGGRAEWGYIGGDISDQEDLQEALNAKVNKSGDTMTGPLSFSDFSISSDDGLAKIEGTQYGLRVDTTTGLGAALLTANGLGDVLTSLNVQSTYSSTGMDPVNGTAVASAISGKQDTLSTAQQAAVDSGIDSTKVGQIATNTSNISTIEGKIPAQASAENQLADKNFVNSSIATNTANFIGTFNSVADLEAYSGTVTNNDYAFVVNSVVTDNGSDWANTTDLNAYDKTLLTNFDYAWVVNGSKFDLYRFDIVNQTWELRAQNIHKDTSLLNTAYNRYKATVSGSTVTWEYEYTLNNSSFTAAQWAAINSGITDTAVTQIGTNTTNIATKQPKTLDTPITVEGTSQTTVEGALGAINTLAAKGLQNKAQDNTSLAILGYSGNTMHALAVGYQAQATNYATQVGKGTASYAGVSLGCDTMTGQVSVSIGTNAKAENVIGAIAIGGATNTTNNTKATATRAIAIGSYGYDTTLHVEANAQDAIQLGAGINSTASTFQVYTYPMLDGTTGKIPNARLNLDSALNTSSTNPVENQAVATALNSKISYALTIREW